MDCTKDGASRHGNVYTFVEACETSMMIIDISDVPFQWSTTILSLHSSFQQISWVCESGRKKSWTGTSYELCECGFLTRDASLDGLIHSQSHASVEHLPGTRGLNAPEYTSSSDTILLSDPHSRLEHAPFWLRPDPYGVARVSFDSILYL